MKTGLVLFAHGSRNPRWAEPFEQLLARVQRLRPDGEARLAYLEVMKPDLAGAVESLVGAGCNPVRVVPVFLGQGGHVREDLPALVNDLRGRYLAVTILLAPPAGEDALVLDAIAEFCVRETPR